MTIAGLETGQTETLDSRPEAGSGGAFAWQHNHRIKSIKKERLIEMKKQMAILLAGMTVASALLGGCGSEGKQASERAGAESNIPE